MVNIARAIAAILFFALAACSSTPPLTTTGANGPEVTPADYRIGPGDQLQIFVWRNPELSITVPVRPDGKISIPLVQDVVAIGKTPMELGAEVKDKLKQYVTEPDVTIIVLNFVGPFSQQVRVIGEASKPQAVPYRANMTLLDVMIQVGGLTKFAAGNRSTVVRRVNGHEESYRVYLDSLINDGDVEYNAPLQPGDILIIPQTYF
jgi:polysaccharide biosynthesis/export protein